MTIRSAILGVGLLVSTLAAIAPADARPYDHHRHYHRHHPYHHNHWHHHR